MITFALSSCLKPEEDTKKVEFIQQGEGNFPQELVSHIQEDQSSTLSCVVWFPEAVDAGSQNPLRISNSPSSF